MTLMRDAALDRLDDIQRLRPLLDLTPIGKLERAVIEAAINKRRCDVAVASLEAQRSNDDSTHPNFVLLETLVGAQAFAYNAGVALEESVDALISARERQ